MISAGIMPSGANSLMNVSELQPTIDSSKSKTTNSMGVVAGLVVDPDRERREEVDELVEASMD